MTYLIVLATGRCGTTYLSKVFTSSNFDCRHERLGQNGGIGWPMIWQYPRYSLKPNLLTLHLLREPLSCISSLTTFKGVWPTVRKHGFIFSKDPIHRCMQYYLTWYHICTSRTPHLITLNQLRLPSYQKQIEDLIHAKCNWDFPRNTNTRPHATLTWDDLFRTDERIASALQVIAANPQFEE